MRYTLLPLILCASALALDDIPVYYDVGCSVAGVPKSYAGGSSELVTATVDGNKTIPTTCTDKYRGTDAAALTISNDFGNGGYFDVVFKFGDDKFKYAGSHTDVRFRVKNLLATPAKLRPVIQNKSYSNKPAQLITVPASQDWTEYTVPLSQFTGFYAATDSVVGVGFGYSYNYGDAASGSKTSVLIDDIRITDGTDHVALDAPVTGAGPLPTDWPSHLVVGSMDVRENGKTSAAVQGGEYRYQYIMPESFISWGDPQYAYSYAIRSSEIGVKSGFVWYNLGKVSESLVAQNLADNTFMTDYVDRYEDFLSQLAQAYSEAPSQSNYIIVLEPDMYGKLMQDGKLPNMDCSELTVNMAHASSVTGTTYDNTLCGWAQYVISRAKSKLTGGVVIGHMLNHWGVNIPGQIGQGRIEAHIMGGYAQGNFLNSLGDWKGDVVFIEKTDRDAGTKPTNEDWFWDASNYAKYFTWVKCLSGRSGLRVIGWQVSEGTSTHPVAANKDDAIEYFVAHPDEWAAAGFIGILFGAGMSGQANYGDDNDGGTFLSLVTQYYASPLSISNVIGTPVLRSVQADHQSAVVAVRGGIQVAASMAGVLELRDARGALVLSQSVSAGLQFVPLPSMRGTFFWKMSGGVGLVVIR